VYPYLSFFLFSLVSRCYFYSDSGMGNNVITMAEIRENLFESLRHIIKSLLYRILGRVNIDAGTYHPASASKKSAPSSSSSCLLASNGVRVSALALGEVGVLFPRSFALWSIAHSTPVRVILSVVSLVKNSLSNKSPNESNEARRRIQKVS
jgi:hypothetical protein